MTQPQESLRSWPRFQTRKPRILLLTSQFFLLGEIRAACERLGVEHVLLDLQTKEMVLDDFVRTILGALTTFRPDFVLTVNHLGVDREGVLLQILEALDLPLASWFVDNPHLILPAYPRTHADKTLVFSWDADSLESLRAMGYPNTQWLPLGSDPHRFHPGAEGRPDWDADVSFVGNSMVGKVLGRYQAAAPGDELAARVGEIATAFGSSNEPSAVRFMLSRFPELREAFLALESPARMLAFDTLLTWQSTLDYRLDCVKRLLPFLPMIVGDKGWKELLAEEENWRLHPEVSYYDELPGLYPRSKVNFNCTSLQMKGAVNQRVFDVPACGAFLITDHRRQMDQLFEPEKEVVTYANPEEIPELVERYLADPAARDAVAQAAQKRLLAEHTYDHRLEALMRTMRLTFEPAART
ncbi:MAG: glycosyltransferase [Desulfovibrio sp.]